MSADKFFSLMEQTVFSDTCNGIFKDAVAGGKKPCDIITMGKIKD